MASFHLSVKTVGRAAGRSATAAAAYRTAAKIIDERTGEIHDYRRRGGVESADLILPTDAPDWASDRGQLWNAAEASETRKNSTVAREFEIALPAELSPAERRQLAHDFAREIVERHGCAADVAIHAPGGKGDNRNHHAHILCTTRRLMPDGFGEKTRELDERKSGEVDRWRERFAQLQNRSLERAGVAERVDHRTLEAQGVGRMPTVHLGPAAKAIEERTGMGSEVRLRASLERAKSIRAAEDKRNAEQLERVSRRLDKTIVRLAGEISAAVSKRVEQATKAVKAGVADFRAKFEQSKAIEAGVLQARQAFEKNKADQERKQQAEAVKKPEPPQTERPQSRPKRDNGPDFSR